MRAVFLPANHAPVAVCNGSRGVGTINIDVGPGARVGLTAAESRDPGGDKLGYRWWVHREAGTYDGDVAVEGSTGPDASVIIPKDAAGRTIHVILEVTDDGAPPVTSYRRIVISVKP